MIRRLHVKGTCPKQVAGAPPVSVRLLQPNLLPADTLPCGETVHSTHLFDHPICITHFSLGTQHRKDHFGVRFSPMPTNF